MMTLSLQNMRDGVLLATGTDINDWTNGNADLDLYINKSWWDIMDQFDFREKEALPLIFQTIAGTNSYDLIAQTSPIIFEALQRISIEDPNDFSHTDLLLLSDFDYENEYIEGSTQQAKPTNYFRRNNKLYLYPTPDQAYNLTFYYAQILGDIASGGPIIPQAWHEVIEMGAKWRALADLRDMRESAQWKNLQAAQISGRTPVKAKELTDSKMAGIQVYGRDYP
jgi:hypothetical protein